MIRGSLRIAVAVNLLTIIALTAPQAANSVYEVRFDDPIAWNWADGAVVLTIEGDRPKTAGIPELGWRTLSLSGRWPEAAKAEIQILAADTFALPAYLAPQTADWITSDTATPPAQASVDAAYYGRDAWYPSQPVRVEATGRIGANELVSLSWCPLRYNPSRGEIVVIRHAVIAPADNGGARSPGNAADPLSVGDALVAAVQSQLTSHVAPLAPTRSPSGAAAPDWTLSADPPLGVEYVVITGAAFTEEVKPLVRWKARRGITSGLATVAAIRAAYAGIDDAEAVREYLRAAYAQGLQWVVLAGDETVVPVRYAYAGFESEPGVLYNYQICDLYFAETDGNWDADGDGIYGEFIGDQAQIYPELFVGRLPFSTVNEARTIIEKIIAYEAGPDNSNYLTRTLSVSADQMRDWSSGTGQHILATETAPAGWTHDHISMVENPAGDDLAPSKPIAPEFPQLLSAGAGFVNYFVHGRADGFVVRSPGILQFPQSWVLTGGTAGDGHGHLPDIAPTATPGIHLSAACDQGAFDMDTPPFTSGLGESVGERLLFTPQGGAVAFVGQSRWGWVAASYKLVRKFYEYLADPSVPNHVGVYQSLAKTAYSSYRDLVFGNNLFGDPEMPVWKAAPAPLVASVPNVFVPGQQLGTIGVYSGPSSVSGALVTVATPDSVWFAGLTDGFGVLQSDLFLPTAGEIVITVSKPGHEIFADTIPVSIVADVFDDQGARPGNLDLSPNYPNPFNAGTVLRFTTEQPRHATLTIFDILGRRVRTLVDGDLSGGTYTIDFDGTDDRGQPLASGVYFARMVADDQVRIRKMVLLR